MKSFLLFFTLFGLNSIQAGQSTIEKERFEHTFTVYLSSEIGTKTVTTSFSFFPDGTPKHIKRIYRLFDGETFGEMICINDAQNDILSSSLHSLGKLKIINPLYPTIETFNPFKILPSFNDIPSDETIYTPEEYNDFSKKHLELLELKIKQALQ